MTEMILGGDSYEKSCWKWFGIHSWNLEWGWDMNMVILGVILGSSQPDSGFGQNEPDLCEYLLGMAGQNSVILDSGILCTYRNLYFKSG